MGQICNNHSMSHPSGQPALPETAYVYLGKRHVSAKATNLLRTFVSNEVQKTLPEDVAYWHFGRPERLTVMHISAFAFQAASRKNPGNYQTSPQDKEAKLRRHLPRRDEWLNAYAVGVDMNEVLVKKNGPVKGYRLTLSVKGDDQLLQEYRYGRRDLGIRQPEEDVVPTFDLVLAKLYKENEADNQPALPQLRQNADAVVATLRTLLTEPEGEQAIPLTPLEIVHFKYHIPSDSRQVVPVELV
jgi:hypothetical protein